MQRNAPLLEPFGRVRDDLLALRLTPKHGDLVRVRCTLQQLLERTHCRDTVTDDNQAALPRRTALDYRYRPHPSGSVGQARKIRRDAKFRILQATSGHQAVMLLVERRCHDDLTGDVAHDAA